LDLSDVEKGAFGVEAQSPGGIPHHQLGHWLFGSGRRSSALEDALFGPSARSKRATTVAGVPATIWLVPPRSRGGAGVNVGHVVVTWSQGGRFHWTSVHDHRNARRARLLAEVIMRRVAQLEAGD